MIIQQFFVRSIHKEIIEAACERYYALQDEVRSVEQLLKGAKNIMREDVQERQPHRAQDIDL